MEIGVDCLKIEGRTKSHYYVARTAQAYRRAIDDAHAGRAFDMGLMDELEKLASRGYTEGFYNRHPSGEYQNYERGISRGDYQQFVGEVTALDETARELTVSVNNRFAVGDRLELMTPAGNCEFVLGEMRSLDGSPREVAPGNGHVVKLPLPEAAPPLAPDQPRYAVLARYL
jgi:putative protease